MRCDIAKNYMNDALNSPSQERHPLFSIIILVLFVVMGLFLGNFIGVAAIAIMVNFNMDAITQITANPAASPDYRLPLLILQGTAALGAFIVGPLIYLKQVEKRTTQDLTSRNYLDGAIIFITALATLAVMPFNSKLIEWNKQIRLPEWMAGVEQWAMNKEKELEEITLYVTDFNNGGEFLFGLLVIAVLPAIGEELLFRGLIQPKITRLTRNIHAGVWITAFIFSFFHFQFYGLIPRMLLGALFGYLYVWSGNLVVPMVAHFVNNGFTVLMLYLMKLQYVPSDIESPERVTTLVALSSAFFTIVLLIGFRMYYRWLEKRGQVPPPAYE